VVVGVVVIVLAAAVREAFALAHLFLSFRAPLTQLLLVVVALVVLLHHQDQTVATLYSAPLRLTVVVLAQG
jgi:hypothetical protein